MQSIHIISCCRSVLPDLLHHLHPEPLHSDQSHPLPLLNYLRVGCSDDCDVSALATFLSQCTNLRKLHCERDLGPVEESVEKKMWEAAVKSCTNLEEVRVRGDHFDVSCKRLVSVLKKLPKGDEKQAVKLKRIIGVDWNTRPGGEDYAV